ALVLKQFDRQGNTLSAIMRQAWESGSIRTLTKNSPAKATDAHISLIGHCTVDELRRYMSATEQANGYGNRHLWACVKRSKVLPDGGAFNLSSLIELQTEFAGAIAFARTFNEITRDDAATGMWRDVYGELSEGKPGLTGSMLARGEAHVMRLA